MPGCLPHQGCRKARAPPGNGSNTSGAVSPSSVAFRFQTCPRSASPFSLILPFPGVQDANVSSLRICIPRYHAELSFLFTPRFREAHDSTVCWWSQPACHVAQSRRRRLSTAAHHHSGRTCKPSKQDLAQLVMRLSRCLEVSGGRSGDRARMSSVLPHVTDVGLITKPIRLRSMPPWALRQKGATGVASSFSDSKITNCCLRLSYCSRNW
jgi:hypothetical protein